MANDCVGGVAVHTMLGKGQMLCETTSRYSESPEFRFTGMSMGPDRAAKEHISSMTPCLKALKTTDLYLRKNQSLQVIGKYNYGQREGNMENGKQGEVSNETRGAWCKETISNCKQIMAIAMLPIAIPREGLNKPA